ncbi:MAG: HDOD domain-containing protein [bacterium]|nr:HDOD domain-containing protein [bacterium]
MKESAEHFVRGTPEIQSLPEIYSRINHVIEHPNASSEEISKVVMEDPGLSSRLLRLVNSSLFAFPGEIDTVSRAIALVGTQQLRDMALATCVIEMFEDVTSEFVNMESYWEHCLATAVCARLLASHCEEDNIERYFVAGLLHDIGSIVIYLRGGRRLKRMVARCTKERQNLIAAERAVFSFDHTEVGRELLLLWGLPAVLQEAVGAHHAPGRAKRFPRVANITHVAEFLVEARDLGSNGEHLVAPVNEEAWLELGLSIDYLPLIYQDLEDQWLESKSALLS